MKLILFLLSFNLSANEEVLKNFEIQMKKIEPKFKEFDSTSGEKFFRYERINSDGQKVSCMTCHTSDPKSEGKTRANKIIDPLAPVANKDRFTDLIKVEKWFKRNCKDVYERECTVLEKGNFIKYMMLIK